MTGGVSVSPSHSCLCVNAELPAPRPSISVSPSGVIVLGAAVTIRCQCQCEARKLFLYKDGIQIKELDAGARDEFTIPSARRGDGGFYSCRSHSTCLLLTAELSYPKPSISLSPHGEVVLGGTVIIRCECRCQNVTVLMYKLGNPDVRRWAETAGGVAEFTIDNVSWRDTGSYSCQYGTESDPPVWSHPSDPVELMVAGEEPAQYLCSVTGFPGWVCGTAGLSVPPTWGFPRNCDADVKLQTLAGPALTQPSAARDTPTGPPLPVGGRRVSPYN
uniref:Leukocyte immunoglobulin-like receptor subfamily A member 6 n=1 Tax=Gopherus evgoodei TaxID=1825980 RepID=A0A8C5F0Z8_9SAUR